jgi:cytochrome c2
MESYNKGKTVFKANCAVCHSMSDRHLTGPGLKNIADRVPSAGWLKAYILNADSMRRSGDPYSQKLYVESDSLEMTVFTGVLTKQDVTDLICYLKANRGS